MSKGVPNRHGPQAFRYYRNLKAASHPDGGDSSTPKFSNDDEHVASVRRENWGRGFPVLDTRPFRRAAA